MKPTLLIGAIALFVMSCSNEEKETTLTMNGAYKMTSISMKNATIDTTSTSRKQMKIYTADHMIYGWVNDADSTAGFGIGSYDAMTDSLVENIMYTAEDSTSNDSLRHYTLHIKKQQTGGYTQTIDSIGTVGNKINLVEVYDSVGLAVTSPLDGAWKLKEAYFVSDKGDTSREVRTQYKVYNAGNVIWGNNYKDSSGTSNTIVGFGTFAMTGDTLCKESMIASNISAVTGHTFDLGIELMGTDGFKQTIRFTAGKTVEVYERMKK